jgi:hypothetical protein
MVVGKSNESGMTLWHLQLLSFLLVKEVGDVGIEEKQGVTSTVYVAQKCIVSSKQELPTEAPEREFALRA